MLPGAISVADALWDGVGGQVDSEEAAAHKKCCICLVGAKDTLLTPCGHISTCLGCAHILQEQSMPCPICRGRIDQAFRAFVS